MTVRELIEKLQEEGQDELAVIMIEGGEKVAVNCIKKTELPRCGLHQPRMAVVLMHK